MTKYKFTEEDYREAVKVSFAITDVCRFLGIIPVGGNIRTVKGKLEKYGIDTSHFLGQAHNKGRVFNPQPTHKDTIKKRLVIERGHKCESCENADWLDAPITLELEHIDGNNKNNEYGNLLLLCPNCHSQTKTWRRAKSSLSSEPKPETICECGSTKGPRAKMCKECWDSKRASKITSNSNPNNPRTKSCSCGNFITAKAKQCIECSQRSQHRIAWPSNEELIELLRSNSYLAVAKNIGVSDTAIRKHLKRRGYNLKTFEKDS